MRGRSTPLRAQLLTSPNSASLVSLGSTARVLAAFIAYDELRVSQLPVGLLAVLICALASAVLAAIERPWTNVEQWSNPAVVVTTTHSPSLERRTSQRIRSNSSTATPPHIYFLTNPLRDPPTIEMLRGGAVAAVVLLLFLSGLKAAGPVRAMLSDTAKLLIIAGTASTPLAAAAATVAGLALQSTSPSHTLSGGPSSLSPSPLTSARGRRRVLHGLLMVSVACLLIAYDGSGTAPKPHFKKAVIATTKKTLMNVRRLRPKIPFRRSHSPNQTLPADDHLQPPVAQNNDAKGPESVFRRIVTLDRTNQVPTPALVGATSRTIDETAIRLERYENAEENDGDSRRSSFNFDSELGVVLIFLSAIVDEVCKSTLADHASGEVHSRRMQNVWSMVTATALLSPVAALSLFSWRPVEGFRLLFFSIRSLLCACLFFVIPFYSELHASVMSKSTKLTRQRHGYLATACVTLLMSLMLKHEFSFFLVLSTAVGIYAHHRVCSAHRAQHLRRTASDGMIGISDSELDNVTGSATGFTEFLRAAVHDQESRQLLNFLIFQAAMVIVESIYGILTDSIGLISASADTILCCVALFIGLRTTDVTRNRPDATFTYGYHRLESLSGFVNGILLIFVAFLVIFESVDRVIEPQDIENTRVVVISLVSSVCNGLGLIVFPPKNRRENHNLEGAYLHIWANTLATSGLLVSALLSESLGWQSSGNLVAVGVSVIIVWSAIPLLKRSATLLLLNVRDGLDEPRGCIAQRIATIEGVEALQSLRVWELTPSNTVVSARVFVTESTDEVLTRQRVIAAVEEELRTCVCVVQVASGAVRPSLQHSQVTPMNHAMRKHSILL